MYVIRLLVINFSQMNGRSNIKTDKNECNYLKSERSKSKPKTKPKTQLKIKNSNSQSNYVPFDIDSYINNSVDQILNKDEPKTIDTLVLSGGEIKFIAQMGALHYMENIGILDNIQTLAGTSAGCCIASLLVIGYRPVEIYHFFMNANVKNFRNISAYNFFSKLGLDDGKRFVMITKKLIKAKSVDPNITFKELHRKTGKNLIITGTCVNDKKTYYFSHDTEPDMRLIDAMRISISIPIIFTPRKYKGMVFVDGGCTDNYPIALFNYKIDQVIGIYVSEKKFVDNGITSIESFMTNTVKCIREGMDINCSRGYEDRTIYIKCESGDEKHNISAMFDHGYRETFKFFKKLGVKD